MEKIDILLIAVGIFGAAAFFAISYCIKLHRCLYDIYNILNTHHNIVNNAVKLLDEDNKRFKTQSEFNKCIINNIDKLERKINKASIEFDTFPTGGRRSEAEA